MAIVAPAPRQQLAGQETSLTPLARLFADILTAGPDVPRPLDVEPLDLISWCRRNKVPLIGIADMLPGWLTACPAFREALDAERTWHALQREEFLAVDSVWRECGVENLMIKSAGNPPSFPHTSDNIDILVRPEDGRTAREVLRALEYVELRNVEEPEKFLFRRFHGGDCVSAIHVHERIAWFVGFLDDDDVWRRSRPADDDPCLTIPSPEDAVLINLAHACYENKELRLLEVMRVRHALRSAAPDFDWAYVEDVARRRGWSDGLAFMMLVHAEAERAIFGETLVPTPQLAAFRAAIRNDRPVARRLAEIEASGIRDLPLDLSYRFCKRLYYRKILRDPAWRWSERARDTAATLIWGFRLKSGLRPQPGMIVSISGPDGSGKTAHAEALVAALRQCEVKASYLWSRGGSSGLIAWLSGLYRRLRRPDNAPEPGEGDAIARRRARLQRPLVRFTWAWLVAVDQLATYWTGAYLPALFGRVVVADRYVYDAAVELNATLPSGARWSRLATRAMLRFAPRPSIGYLLDVSLATAQARKPDEPWHIGWPTERWYYQVLASRYGLRCLSTEGPFAASSDPLIHDVIMAFMARYETRLNGLLYSNPSQKNQPDPIWVKGSA